MGKFIVNHGSNTCEFEDRRLLWQIYEAAKDGNDDIHVEYSRQDDQQNTFVYKMDVTYLPTTKIKRRKCKDGSVKYIFKWDSETVYDKAGNQIGYRELCGWGSVDADLKRFHEAW